MGVLFATKDFSIVDKGTHRENLIWLSARPQCVHGWSVRLFDGPVVGTFRPSPLSLRFFWYLMDLFIRSSQKAGEVTFLYRWA